MAVTENALDARIRYVALTADTLPTTANAGDRAQILDGNDKVFDGATWQTETSSVTSAATVADGANVVEGSTTDAAVSTDANGTINAHIRGIVKLLVGVLKVTLTPVGSVAPTNVTSTALEASHVIKNAAGILWGMSGFNNKTSGQYIQLYDSATVPADTAVPVLTQWVPAQSPFTFDFGLYGRGFASGISIANSSTLATKTIGSADCWFDAQLT